MKEKDMTNEEIGILRKVLNERFDTILELSKQEFNVYELIETPENSIESLCDNLIKLEVQEINLKKEILDAIRRNQKPAMF